MNLPRLDGKLVLVTGANSGIGFETARALAKLGAGVVLGVRDPAKGEEARRAILREAPNARVEVERLDLADLDDVRRFAAAFRAKHPRLDVLVNNAGIHTARFARSPQGFESTFATNHLGPFLLTNELRPTLEAAAPSRVVTVASQAHLGARVDWDDLDLQKDFSGFRAYANSKLFNIWFARELARRLEGTRVTSNVLHPGSVRTRWARGESSGLFRFGVALASPFLLSPEKGARTPLFLAASPEVEGKSGGYYVRRKLAQPSPLARDDAQATRLWETSERLVNARSGSG